MKLSSQMEGNQKLPPDSAINISEFFEFLKICESFDFTFH